MLRDNLLGYEENFYSKIFRTKLLERHHKKIEEINNRKNKFSNNSIDYSGNYLKNSRSKHKRKPSFNDPVVEFKKDMTNFILAKRIIDISNRDIQKGSFCRLDSNSPFIEMKKAIKKNLDKFKEKQIGVENFKIFKRLSNKQSTLIPNGYVKAIDVKTDSADKKQIIKRRKSSIISNYINKGITEDDKNYKKENLKIKRRNSNKKFTKFDNNEFDFVQEIINQNQKLKDEFILPEIKPLNPYKDKNERKYDLNENQNLEIQLVYSNLKDKIREELNHKHGNLRNNLKLKNNPKSNHINFEEN